MNTKFLRFLSFISVIGLYPQASFSNDVVSENVINRASQIAIAAGGDGTIVKSVQRAQNLPGLRQATLVIYNDASGNLANLIMLPDGVHFIAGPIGAFDEKSKTIGSAIISNQSVATTVVAQPKSPPPVKIKPDTFTLDGILRPSNFSTAGIALFSNPDKAPEYFMEILASANGIQDGNKGRPVYILFDPACGYCQQEYHELRPLIESGKITAYWIPVVGPSAPPYTELVQLIDPNSTNEVRLKRLTALMQGATITDKIEQMEAATQMLERTTTLLSLLRSERSPDRGVGTPQTFFVTDDGTIRHEYGYSDDLANKLEAFSK